MAPCRFRRKQHVPLGGPSRPLKSHMARETESVHDGIMAAMERGTGTETIQEDRTDIRLDEGDHDRFAHYVEKSKLTEALINGTPVIALCGKVWVPSRDPERFPICPECKRLYDLGPEGRRREWEGRVRDAGFGGTD